MKEGEKMMEKDLWVVLQTTKKHLEEYVKKTEDMLTILNQKIQVLESLEE